MKRKEILIFLLTGALLLSGCGAGSSASTVEKSSTTDETTVADASSQGSKEVDTSDMFTDRDKEIGYDEESSAHITLADHKSSCDSNAVQIDGNTITITEEGTYFLSGELTDGMVIVDAEDTDKVQLVLDGVEITSAESAAIYVRSADKVFLTTASGSENILTNGGTYTAIDDNNIDAVIFSKDDLTLNGAGTLTIHALAGHGVVSKDDLVLTSGTYDITAEKHGLSGKDSSGFGGRGGDIFAAEDGAYIHISGGTLHVNASGDGIDSNGELTISGGETYVSGPTNSGNGALDYNGEGVITGGIFVAAGSSGMAQNFSNSSTQGAMMVTVNTQMAGSSISLADNSGKELVSWTADKEYNSVVISCPEITQGATYTLTAGSDTQEITMDSLVYGSGGMGQMPGNGMPKQPGNSMPEKPGNGMPEKTENSMSRI